MDWKSTCAIVIPCLNEAATIGPLVREARGLVDHVIVVDDGSTDATAELAEQNGAQVLRHDHPLGKGVSLKQGWTRASELGATWVLLMDGDGQHLVREIPLFWLEAVRAEAKLVIGNRMGADAGRKMPRLRRWVNRWMSQRLSRLVGYPVPDSQCGFRLIHLPTLQRCAIEAAHFEIESEILVSLARNQVRACFVPISVVYQTERSKIHPWRDTRRWFQWLRRVRAAKNISPAQN